MIVENIIGTSIMTVGMILWFIGVFSPVIPGVLFAFVSLFAMELSDYQPTIASYIVWAILLGVTMIADFVAPIITTKQRWWSKRSQWGWVIGWLLGIFGWPIGIFLWPILWAFIGEIIGTRSLSNARKASIGNLVWFLVTIGIKFFVMVRYLNVFIKWIFSVRFS